MVGGVVVVIVRVDIVGICGVFVCGVVVALCVGVFLSLLCVCACAFFFCFCSFADVVVAGAVVYCGATCVVDCVADYAVLSTSCVLRMCVMFVVMSDDVIRYDVVYDAGGSHYVADVGVAVGVW